MRTLRRFPRAARSGAPLLLLLATLTVPSDAGAQDRSRDSERSELEERVRARFAELVRRRLGLSEEQERTLASVVESFQDERRELGRRQGTLRRRIRSLDLDDRSTDEVELSVEEARAILEEMAAVRAEEVRLLRAEQEALLQILGPVQVLQFHQLREDMADRIRRARGRRGGDDGHRRGGGPPPGR